MLKKCFNVIIILLIFLFSELIAQQTSSIIELQDLKNISRTTQNFIQGGQQLSNQQQYDSAAIYFEKALKLVSSEKNPILKVKINLTLCELHLHQNKYQRALQFVQKADTLIKQLKIKDKWVNAKMNSLMGLSYWYFGRYNQALKYYLKAKQWYSKLADTGALSAIYNTVGAIQWSLGNFDLATENYKSALKLAEETNNFERQVRVLNNIGLVYQSWNRWQEALTYHKQALKLAEEKAPDGFGLIYSKINIALVSMEMGQFDEAYKLFNIARKYFEQINDLAGLSYISKYLGDLFDRQGNREKALEYYSASLNFGKQVQNNYRICEALLNIGRMYQDSNIDKAEEYFKKSLAIARREGYKKQIIEIYQNLALNYKNKHEYEKAFEYLNQTMALKDSLLSEQKLAALSDLQLQLLLEHQKSENELLKSDNQINELKLRNEKIIRTGLIIVLLLGILVLFLIWRRWQLSRELNDALKEQNETIRKINEEKEKLIKELKEALENISRLQGLLPICSNCKKIRDDEGYWQSVEEYISSHTYVKFSHGLCPECAKELYPEVYQKIKDKK